MAMNATASIPPAVASEVTTPPPAPPTLTAGAIEARFSAVAPANDIRTSLLKGWITEQTHIPDGELEPVPSVADEEPPGMGEQQITQQYVEGSHQHHHGHPYPQQHQPSGHHYMHAPRPHAELMATVSSNPNVSRTGGASRPPPSQGVHAPIPDHHSTTNGVPPNQPVEGASEHINEAIQGSVASPYSPDKSLRRCQKASTAAVHMSMTGLRSEIHDALRPFNTKAIATANQRRELQHQKEAQEKPEDEGPHARISASKKRRQRRMIRKASSNGVGTTCSGVCYQSLLQLTAAVEKAVEDSIIKHLTASSEAMSNRYKALRLVCAAAKEALWSNHILDGMTFYVYGSVHLRTVLPNGDNDVTLVLDSAKEGNSSLVPSSVSLLTMIEEYINRTRAHQGSMSNIMVDKLVQAPDVQVLKLEANGMHVDLSINQMGGAATSCFLHEVDASIGQGHLFKSTLLLLKAWCSYEAHILGSDNGYLGTYALSVMLIAVFNGIPDSVIKKGIPSSRTAAMEAQKSENTADCVVPLTPLKAFLMFLDYYASFDFDQYAISIHGPVAIADLQTANVETATAALAFSKSSRVTNTSAASSVEYNKANGISVMGRRAGTCFSANNSTTPPLVSASSPTVSAQNGVTGDSPTLTPRLSPRGLMRTPNDAEEVYRVAESSTPYHSPIISREALTTMVDSAAKTDEGISLAQKAYFIQQRDPALQPINYAAGGPGVASESATDAETPVTADAPDLNNAPTSLFINYFKVRIMNIRDPLRPYSNLTRGITRNHLCRIQGSFRRGAKMLRAFISQAAAADDPTHELGSITPSELVQGMFRSVLAAASAAECNTVAPIMESSEDPYICKNCKVKSLFCTDPEGTNKYLLQFPPADQQQPNRSRSFASGEHQDQHSYDNAYYANNPPMDQQGHQQGPQGRYHNPNAHYPSGSNQQGPNQMRGSQHPQGQPQHSRYNGGPNGAPMPNHPQANYSNQGPYGNMPSQQQQQQGGGNGGYPNRGPRYNGNNGAPPQEPPMSDSMGAHPYNSSSTHPATHNFHPPNHENQPFYHSPPPNAGGGNYGMPHTGYHQNSFSRGAHQHHSNENGDTMENSGYNNAGDQQQGFNQSPTDTRFGYDAGYQGQRAPPAHRGKGRGYQQQQQQPYGYEQQQGGGDYNDNSINNAYGNNNGGGAGFPYQHQQAPQQGQQQQGGAPPRGGRGRGSGRGRGMGRGGPMMNDGDFPSLPNS